MNKAEKALRREIVAKALTTNEGIDAVIELLDSVLAHQNHPDPTNDDDGREVIDEAVDSLVDALGYGVEDVEDDEDEEDEEDGG